MPIEHLEGAATLPDAIAATIERFAHDPALSMEGRSVSYAELGDVVARLLAEPLFTGLPPRSTVVIGLSNSPVIRVLEFAVLIAGHVRAPVSPRLHPREIAEIAAGAGAALVFVEADAVHRVRAYVEESDHTTQVHAPPEVHWSSAAAGPLQVPQPASVSPDDAAVVLYSSGTTGQPKGAVHSHRTWLAHVRMAIDAMPPLGPGDVVLGAAPLSHFAGTIALDCAFSGAALATTSDTEPEAIIRLVGKHRATVLPLVPVMLTRLATNLDSTERRLPDLRAVPYGGSMIAVSDLARAAATLPGVLIQFYGLAEALAPISVLSSEMHDAGLALRRAGDPAGDAILASCGAPVKGAEVRVCGGRIHVRTLAAMVGYRGSPSLTAKVRTEDGWFDTADLGQLAGRSLTVLGRDDDLIVTGGFTVQPAEVERVLRLHSAVTEACVVGTPHETWGMAVTAAVTLSRPTDPATLAEDLRELCRLYIAGFKKPLGVHIIETIPLTAVGKIDRRAVRRRLADPAFRKE